MPAAVGVRAGRSSIGLTAPNELGGELRDGNGRNLYPDELFDSPPESPASAGRLHEEPGWALSCRARGLLALVQRADASK